MVHDTFSITINLHLILYGISGLDDYFVMLSMDNAYVCPLQHTRNEIQGQFKPISPIVWTCRQNSEVSVAYLG